MEWFEEYILLHGVKVKYEIPLEMYQELINYQTNDQLAKNYELCLNNEYFENLAIIQNEFDKRGIKVNITGDVNKINGKYKLIK